METKAISLREGPVEEKNKKRDHGEARLLNVLTGNSSTQKSSKICAANTLILMYGFNNY